MQKTIKKLMMAMSVFGVAVLLAGCNTCGYQDQKKHSRPHREMQRTESVVYYQTYENADVTKVGAKMFTRNGQGEESKMGYISFNETDAGLKMTVDLKDLRPGVKYTVRIHPCNACDTGMCCSDKNIVSNMPKLRISKQGRLEETFVLHGVTAQQLNDSKIYLERDGGVKAAWGRIGQDM
ncbi:MAG: hypothetical protein MJ187_02105 [Alphaproteobacteria bacterium]|nr:hypothetical protein [Alphaproteobacteria bacterium]